MVARTQIIVRGIPIAILRKDIKNLHLSVCPPDGEVRVSVPLHMTDDNIRLAVITRLSWIKKQQALFKAQPRQSEREMVTGESHYVFGKRYRLEVIERRGRHEIKIKNSRKLQLFVNPGTTTQNRRLALTQWYRQQLKDRIPQLLNQWEPVIGKSVKSWRVQRMKTKWGSCNSDRQAILLNLELAKKPVECLEYVVVHELVHLLERNHSDRFRAYLDQFVPQWRLHRDTLQQHPLGHEQWGNSESD
ncbi:MAG: SprT family zinc-dependent metalloprotease [Cyanobacteria bacterium P01_H01_bin.121]